MRWLKDNIVRLVLIGFAAVTMFNEKRAQADFIFGEPTNLGPAINSPGNDAAPCLSADGLSLYFSCGGDIWVAQRATPDSEWDQGLILGQNINIGDNSGPFITPDGLMLFMDSDRAGGCGSYDLWMMTRTTVDSNWGTPINLGPSINSAFEDWGVSLSPDGLELYFTSSRPGGHGIYDLWVTSRVTVESNWSPPTNLGLTLNTSDAETFPSLSSDGLLLFFCSSRPGGYGSGLGRQDLYMARRTTRNDPWDPPINLGPKVNGIHIDSGVKVSADGSMLYFHSNRPGGYGNMDLWQAPIIPIVDLNGDGIVDADDMVIMVDNWGTDNSLCDIGPMPWGDGIVDVQDLIVLAEHLFNEVDDPTLLAHWKLDEEEGMTAYDSVGTNDGTIIGSPQWRLEDGAVDGALEFNGTTFIAFNPVLNPADGPFSMLVWVKGGGPGQVVASSGWTNWLMADTATGALMTELSNIGQNGVSLGPEAVITDGNWHRIAFTWDGTNARLYVDTLLVAEDAQDGLVNSSTRLLLGTGMDRKPATYWSGLIDDVRIYNRVVSP